MGQDTETARKLRALIEDIDSKLLQLIEDHHGLDHDHLQRIAVLETARSAAWRLLHLETPAVTS